MNIRQPVNHKRSDGAPQALLIKDECVYFLQLRILNNVGTENQIREQRQLMSSTLRDIHV